MKKIKTLLVTLGIASFISVAIARPARALDCGALSAIKDSNGNDLCHISDLQGVLNVLANYLIGLIGIILAIVILVSAIEIITAAGSPDRIKNAKDRLVQAAVSLGLLISFRVIISLFGIA